MHESKEQLLRGSILLDSKCRVIGGERLRVVDVSSMPYWCALPGCELCYRREDGRRD